MVDKLLNQEKLFGKLPAGAKDSPFVLPAQIQSEDAQLTYTTYHTTLGGYSKPHAALAVRQLLPLLPTAMRSPMDFSQVIRQAKTSVDNTIFVYPVLLDRFKNRYGRV